MTIEFLHPTGDSRSIGERGYKASLPQWLENER